MSANALADQHRAIAERFAELAQARGDQQPVFAIEHELDDVALGELRRTVSEHLEGDPQLTSAAWSWGYLPLVVIATEVGYRYRGTGTDFWPVLSLELGIEASFAFRNGLSRFFELGNSRYRLARPSDSPWELHFPHIAWPIGNSVVPLEIQPQLTDALRRAVRAGISADDTEMLLEYIRSLAAGHASRRFENWLLRKDLALEVMRRLLAPGTPGWLSNGIISRIDRDIRKDWGRAREGRLVLPADADGVCFAPIVLSDGGAFVPNAYFSGQPGKPEALRPASIDIAVGDVTLRLDGATTAIRIAEIVWAIGERP